MAVRSAISKIARIGAGSRARSALATNALSSIGNLTLTVFIARSEGSSGFGAFAVAFAVYVLIVGLSQAMVIDGLLASDTSPTAQRSAAQRVVLIAGTGSLLTIAFGMATDSAYLVTIGVAGPGLALYDFIKSVNLGVGSPRTALTQELIWTGTMIGGAVASSVQLISSEQLFMLWAFSGALIGVVNALRLHYSLIPQWGLSSAQAKTTTVFGIDHLAGAGTAQVTTMALASLAGATVVGALRGAGTLLGPVTLVTGTVRGLLIPYLARYKGEAPSVRLRSAGLVALAFLLLSAPLTFAVLLIPAAVGEQMIGSTWTLAQPLLPAIVLEAFFGAASAVAFSGHRVEAASLRTLTIRCVLAPIRVVAVVIAGVWAGSQGAAIAMAVSAAVGAAIWWWSYTSIVKGSTTSESIKNRPGGSVRVRQLR